MTTNTKDSGKVRLGNHSAPKPLKDSGKVRLGNHSTPVRSK